MAAPRIPLSILIVAVIIWNQDITVSGATLNLTASASGAVNEGSSLTLTCTINGSQIPTDTVYFDSALSWLFFSDCSLWTSSFSSCPQYYLTNECHCSSRSSSTPWIFIRYFREVETRHGRNWRCRLLNTGDTSNTLAISVHGAPTKPTLSPLASAAPVGGSVSLMCSSQPTSMPESIRSSLVYTWYRGGATISGSGSNLTLWNVQTTDEGRYTCEAKESGKNLTSERSNEVYVDVQYAPRAVTLSPSTSSYEVIETTGSVPNIRCQADCDPPCLFRWTDKGGNPVGGTGSYLQLTSLRRDQSGMFTCSAANHLGLSTVQVNITATYPPEVTLTQTEVKLEEGDDVTVPCHVDASPPAEVSWSKVTAGDHVTLQSSPLLELRGVGEGDAGLYTCSATNRLSPQPSQASLRVHVTAAESSGLSWPAGLGIGIAVGLIFCTLLAGLVFLVLFLRRKRRRNDMQREDTGENSYETLDHSSRRDVRDNATYQQFNLYENQDFVLVEDLIRNGQARGGQGHESQTEEGAVGQSQNPRAGNSLSTAEERQGRASSVDEASSSTEGRSNRAENRSSKAESRSSKAEGRSSRAETGSSRAEDRSSRAEDKESRRSKAAEKANRRSAAQDRETWRGKAEGSEGGSSGADGKQDGNLQDSNGRLSGASQNNARKSAAAKKEEGKDGGKNQGKEGGKNQGKEGDERNGEERESEVMAEPFYMNTSM